MKRNKRIMEKGITLVALVITIVILLILAGIAIASLTGENGLITRAQEARTKTDEANAREQVQIAVVGSLGTDGNINLDDLNTELSKIEGLVSTLPISKLPAIVNVDGYEVGILGNGETVPIAKIEDIENAVYVSQKTLVQDENNDIIVLPEGFTIRVDESTNNADSIEEGIVVENKEGNQYVWIPCTIDGANGTLQYKREESKWYIEDDGGTKATRDELTLLDDEVQYSETDLSNGINGEIAQEIVNQINAEKTSIKKYTGFYIGRYEVGKENNEAVIQQNKEPYASIKWVDAYNLAKGIESGSNATSYLCSSYAWDTALSFIESKPESSDYGSNISKYNGNWLNKQVVDKNGNVIKEAGVGQRLNTGLTTALCNIYDMGGNVGEFTTELNPVLSETVVLRGNLYHNDGPAGDRWDNYSSFASAGFGLRATLFLK